jgi:hypothetical protein
VNYLHLNPARVGKVKGQELPAALWERLESYPWSSHQAYAGSGTVPEWLNLEWLNYWGSKKAQTSYRRHLRRAFEKGVESPLVKVRGGLVLGGRQLLHKVQNLLEQKPFSEEKRWREDQAKEERQDRLKLVLERERDEKVRVWLRVRLGGEKMTEIGKELGYRDGAGVHLLIKRLEERATVEIKLRRTLEELRKELCNV